MHGLIIIDNCYGTCRNCIGVGSSNNRNNYSSGEVDVFDCMSATISSGLKNQIAALLCTENQNIILRFDHN